MELLFLYILPALITFIIGAFWIVGKFKHDFDYEGCPTIGTIVLVPLWLAFIFTPALNMVSAIVGIVFTLFEYDTEIVRFFEQPICRKKK